MFKFIKALFTKQKDKSKTAAKESLKLSKSLAKNLQMFRELLQGDDLVVFREFTNQHYPECKFGLIFVNGLVNDEAINENIIAPLMEFSGIQALKEKSLDLFLKKTLITNKAIKETDINKLLSEVLYGSTLLLVEGVNEALLFDTTDFKYRSITEPIAESVLRGPREGFTEAILVNISMIRRRFASPELKFKLMKIGKRTQTRVCLCYLEGVASPKIVADVTRKLQQISIDGILDSNYLQELIKNEKFTIFPMTYSTERPDVAVAKLLEGRVAILVDGTPYVLTMPCLFMEFFQSNEDYYTNFIFASFNRLLRYVGFFITTSLPGIYIALTTYHQEMIPTPLLLNISAAREGVPFPTVIEALFMVLIFDLLRESGIRLPTPIGSTIGFVGAIIVGQSSVTARMVSAPIVIIAAITGISNFLLPKMLGSLTYMRLFLLILSSVLGLYGYVFGVIAIMIHLMSLRSFGVPYMSNLGSLKYQEMKDTIIRAPWWQMLERPRLIAELDPIRQEQTQQQVEGENEN